jgi:U4/U6.U5 tri-snRNP-associated protein 1
MPISLMTTTFKLPLRGRVEPNYTRLRNRPQKNWPGEVRCYSVFHEYLLTSISLVAEQRDQQEADDNEAIKAEERDADLQGGGGGLTFDDTSEFVRAVGNNPVVKPELKEVSVAHSPAPQVKHRSPSRDASMAPGDEALEELEAGEVVVKDEDEDEDVNMEILDALEEVFKATEAEEGQQNGNAPGDAMGGTSAEQTFSSGMASTLNILRQQGILSTPAADQKDREKTQLQRDLWLADQRRRVAQRELEKLQSRGANKDQAQREYENRLREQQEARENLEAFKNYKPDVNIVYYDEYGRSLTPKEAWKALSHKFHGKGSGKMKTEKRLKKIAEEKKQAAMASGDTPLSMNSAFQQRQKKAGQAHFVLSVGNRGYVFQNFILS